MHLDLLLLLPGAVAAYLVGSIPSGVLIARTFGWPDPRHHGSRHTGALNVSRGSGQWGLVLVLTADFLKGLLAVLLIMRIAPSPWAVPVAGVAAVVGHIWPVWLGFRGGMGLATGMGAVASQYPLAVLIAAALLGVFRLIIRHTPRATIAAALSLPLALWLLPLSQPVFWLGTSVALLIAFRHWSDWNRVYD